MSCASRSAQHCFMSNTPHVFKGMGCGLMQFGVFGLDSVKSLSVMKGNSVTDVPKIQTDDEITWIFGTNMNLIAKISGETKEIDDRPDGRFRDRLKLDHQTGSLTIINIKTEHAGVYEVNISRRSSETEIRFIVTVYSE
ncbi:SLAM family member 9 [Labeo rohita]|uniref:SLAM family member 9 n=1 Tax=Labeo rohita TaxID=84645 RepID=A0ABQ8LBA3_LABRO|nr:SLAM family member 9 [Labeo rohita]